MATVTRTGGRIGTGEGLPEHAASEHHGGNEGISAREAQVSRLSAGVLSVTVTFVCLTVTVPKINSMY